MPHLVARARTAPPAHVMFLPSFWLLVPGTIGLIGITELVCENPVGTMTVRAVRIAVLRAHPGNARTHD